MLRSKFAVTLVILVAFTAIVLSSRSSNAGDLPSERDEEPGASFFGEAKEAGSMRSIAGVLIKAELGARRIFVNTDAEGRFKLHPNFGTEISSDSIVISCAKVGYQTLDVSRRRMSNAADAPVEVDCLLESKK